MEIRTERLFASGASPTVFGAHLFHGVCGNTLTACSGRVGARRAKGSLFQTFPIFRDTIGDVG